MTRLKVGDKVQVKSLDWYNSSKNDFGDVRVASVFISAMSQYCGKIVTIKRIASEASEKYCIEEDGGFFFWNLPFFEFSNI